MKSMMWRSTFREIRQSLGRFLAILAIVALGVGFFAGLKVTRASMVKTTRKYLEEEQFYDYRILTTLGLDEEDVEKLRGQDGVRAAEGSYTYDIVCVDGAGSEMVLRAHSLLNSINGVVLKAGRLPENAQECVVDSSLYGKDQIGEKIYLAADNAKADLNAFACEEYTIVGIVQSSYYIQFERGNTSLGTGRISGFFYLLPEGFASDYYTEAFVKFDRDFELYSDEYKDYLEEREDAWEALTEEIAAGRYEKVQKLSRDKLADARRELADARAEGEQELADARKELADAKKELEDGEQELADARKELLDGRATLEDKEREAREAQETIADEAKRLADGEAQLEEQTALWETNNTQVQDALAQLETQQSQLDAQRLPLESQQMMLSAGYTQLDSQSQGLDQEARLLELEEVDLNRQEKELYQQTDTSEEEAVIRAGLQALDELEALLRSQNGGEVPPQYASYLTLARERLNRQLQELTPALTPEETEARRSQIEERRQEIAARRREIEDERAVLAQSRAQLEEGRVQLEEGLALIASYQAQIDEGRAQLADASAQLSEGWQQIEDARKQIEDGKVQLGEAKAELSEGWNEIRKAWKEIEDGEKEIADGEKELADGRIEYADGLADYQEGYEEFCREIADAEEEIADAQEQIEEMEAAEGYCLGRDTNVGYVCFESDSRIVDGIADIFPVFFFAVAALVCITTMNRMVEEQRTQIGVLKALGYSRGRIMGKYLFYSGSAAILGCVLGFFGGTWLLPRVIWTAYGMMYKVDRLLYVFDWKLALLSLAVSCACSIGTTWLSCRYELSEAAAELMRPKAPRAGKRVLLEHVTFVWKRLKFLHKVSYRNIFRYKKRFFMMVIGISGCTALLVTGFGIKDSIANVAHDQFQRIQTYELGVTYSDTVDAEKEKELTDALGERAAGYMTVLEKSMDLVVGDRTKSISLLALDENVDISSYLNLHTTGGEALALPGRGECILNEKLAGEYGVAVGDRIRLREEGGKSMELEVTGINENFIYNYVYLTQQTYESLMDEPVSCKTVYIRLAEGADAHMISASLMRLSGVANVNVNADMEERLSSMMRSLDLIVVVVILCAAGLAFIVLYNLTNINITERIREIATLKVLGFYKKESEAYVFRENLVLTFIGALAGLGLGFLLHRFVMSQIKVDMVAFQIHVRPLSYLYSVLLTFGFSWFVDKMMGKKLDGISMTESLKSVD